MKTKVNKTKKKFEFSTKKQWMFFGGAVFMSGLLFLFTAVGFFSRPYVSDSLQGYGLEFRLLSKRDLLYSAKSFFTKKWVSKFKAQPAPLIKIDIKFKHWEKIRKKRLQALNQGLLVSAEGDEVPAQLTFAGKTQKVQMRLKGDLLDHLKSDRWSFRVKVKGDGHVMGMRKFSLQHPQTRGFIKEALYHAHLKSEGVLAPRYHFVDLHINGKEVGLMALEEHFSKEILESQGRKESAIFKFDDTKHWTLSTSGMGFMHPSYAPVDTFGTKKLQKNPVLNEQRINGLKLLRAFSEGKLKASQVFDVETTAKFLALTELWEAEHAIYWTNIRFYYNPYVGKLEPLAFDAHPFGKFDATEEHAFFTGVHGKRKVTPFLLDDEVIRKAYVEQMNRIGKSFANSEILPQLQNLEKQSRLTLWRDFPLIRKFNFGLLHSRADLLSRATINNVSKLSRNMYPRKTIFDARYVKNFVEVTNYTNEEVEITKIEDGGSVLWQGKLSIPAAVIHGKPSMKRIPVKISSDKPALKVFGNIFDQEKIYSEVAYKYIDSQKEEVLKPYSVAKVKQLLPFVKWNKEDKSFTIPAGQWSVSKYVVFPADTPLHVNKGANVKFSENAGFIVNGPVFFKGTKSQPIVFSPKGKTWRGMNVSEANERSNLKFTTFKNTDHNKYQAWQLTGGITFYKSDVDMKDVVFYGTVAEDALNIVGSKFVLDGIEIHNTRSDAFDSDFSNGKVINSAFFNIGGDGVDVSGAQIVVENTTFQKVRDKAVSVGEKSQLKAYGIKVNDSGVAVASKDGSDTEVFNSKFMNIRHAALMSYVKKPEYGPANIKAEKIDIKKSQKRWIAQVQSDIVVDGKKVENEDLDTKKAYKTFMKK